MNKLKNLLVYFLIFIIALLCCGQRSNVFNYAARFHPNQDLMTSLLNLTAFYKTKAASISTCAGSVLYCSIRLANQSFLTNFTGPFEIVSLVGTISEDNQPHIHISLANGQGQMIGGHLPSLEERKEYAQYNFNCPIYTTAEVVISEQQNLIFKREIDPQTTYDELVIYKREQQIVQKVFIDE